jgi:hypothetical protein
MQTCEPQIKGIKRMSSNLLITGASGFVGSALCIEAEQRGYTVRCAVRSGSSCSGRQDMVAVGEIDANTDWKAALTGIDCIIHLAARVHVMHDTVADPLEEFRKVNLHGASNLARQAADSGVKRFIYVSSIKVSGEQTAEGRPYNIPDKTDSPHGPYALSKWETEQALRRIESETGMQVVIVRPPLVYGPGVKGNFLRLLQAVKNGIPLPLAGIRNERSLLYLGNLVDILLACILRPDVAGKTYLVSDGANISTPDLLNAIGDAMQKPARLFYLPGPLLRFVAQATGQREMLARLTQSLCIDDTRFRQDAGWAPRFSLREGLKATTDWYLKQQHTKTEPSLLPRSGKMKEACRISVVVVNYNAGDVLQACVCQATQQAGQVIVIDNASTDHSADKVKVSYPEVIVVENARNMGFAKACNQGAKLAEGEDILFLNPDCILEAGAIQRLADALHSAPDIGMVGGLLANPDGSEQVGGRRAVPTPWRSFVRVMGLGVLANRYPKLFSDFSLHKQPLPEKAMEVEAISGACMLARRPAIEQVGLLDEGYFMHCEDLDWCMRFRRKGWRLLFVPDARMIHHKGHCSASRPIFVEWNKHKGMLRFYNKFFRHQYPGLLMVLVAISVWVRFGLVAGRHLMDRMLNHAGLRRG